MFGLEGRTNAYRYCTNNWKPIVKEARDYIIAMTPVVNLIFLHYRSNHAHKHDNSPEIRQNILHFFQVMETCSRLTFIIGIFCSIYDVRVNKPIGAVALFLFSSSVITAKLLADKEMRFGLMAINASALDVEGIDRLISGEPDGLAYFDANWARLLPPKARTWLSRLFTDCPTATEIVREQGERSISEYDSIAKEGASIDFPIKLWHSKKKAAGLCLLLCSVDDEAIKALVVLSFTNSLISETAFKFKNHHLDSTTPLLFMLFTDESGSLFGSERLIEQTTALTLLLEGGTYQAQGIKWRLGDCRTGQTKSAQSAKKFIEQANSPSPVEDNGLALFNPKWVSLLSSEARMWLGKLSLDCPLIETIVAPQQCIEITESATTIEDGPSMEFPIKLCVRKPLVFDEYKGEETAELCLLLCRTDNPDLKALVVLTISEATISESTWRYNEQKKSKMTNSLLFPSIYTPFGSDEIKEQTKSLAVLLGGESIRREGLISCEEGGSGMGVIEWRLEDYHTDKTKSARNI